MPYRHTTLGCCKSNDRSLERRHFGHWRWLLSLPQHRYCRAIALWHNLYRVRPRGVTFQGGVCRLNFIPS